MSLLTEPTVREAFGFVSETNRFDMVSAESRDKDLDRTARMSSALRGIAEELAEAKRELARLRRENKLLRGG